MRHFFEDNHRYNRLLIEFNELLWCITVETVTVLPDHNVKIIYKINGCNILIFRKFLIIRVEKIILSYKIALVVIVACGEVLSAKAK